MMKKTLTKCVRVKVFLGGGDGSRTHDLYIANVALCQLSYTPEGLRV